MSENHQNINGINVTCTDVKCPECGATIGIRFDPATSNLLCPFCGASTQLQPPEEFTVAKEIDFNTELLRAGANWGNAKKLIICSNCGGQTLYDAEQVTGACPFCGSTAITPAAENEQVMAPNAIIPFTVSIDKTQQCFINFLNRKRCLEKKALKCKLENVVGIYLPFWTFDTLTSSSFVAYNFNYHNESDKYINGVWNQYIDDVIIFASDRIYNPHLARIQKFDFGRAIPYSPEYLAGIPAERYTVGLNEGWERAKKLIEPKLKKDINRSRDYGRIMVEKMNTNYYNVKFRYLLAPVYLATYRYGKKTIPVAINGQTGEAYCDAPTYIRKLILFLVIILFVLSGLEMLIIWLWHIYLPDVPMPFMF